MALLPYSVRQVTQRSKGRRDRGERGDRPDRGERELQAQDETELTTGELEGAEDTYEGAEEMETVAAEAGEE